MTFCTSCPLCPLHPLLNFMPARTRSRQKCLPVYPKEPTPEEIQWQADEEKHGKLLLEESIKMLQSSGIQANPVMLRGDAAKEIIEYAKEQHTNLIVSGSRGLSQFKGWLLGSVSRKLVHYSDCSVLVVKSPFD